MSELWLVVVAVVVWLGAFAMLVGMCVSAKAGDRTQISSRDR